MVPAALGTDTLGSLRIPSALCGTSAIKATHGRVPIDGVIALAPSLDHAGPMARSIADCAALLHGLAAGGAQVTPLMPPPAPVELPLAAAARPAPARRRGRSPRSSARGSTRTWPTGSTPRARRLRAARRPRRRRRAGRRPGPRDMTAIFLTDMGAEHQAHAAGPSTTGRASASSSSGGAATDARPLPGAQAARAG